MQESLTEMKYYIVDKRQYILSHASLEKNISNFPSFNTQEDARKYCQKNGLNGDEIFFKAGHNFWLRWYKRRWIEWKSL